MATNETRLRGKPLTGSEQREAADHVEFEQGQDPDDTVRLDGETDALYDDGLDVEDDSESLADTHGQRGTGG
jgi:hypothetical protein